MPCQGLSEFHASKWTLDHREKIGCPFGTHSPAHHSSDSLSQPVQAERLGAAGGGDGGPAPMSTWWGALGWRGRVPSYLEVQGNGHHSYGCPRSRVSAPGFSYRHLPSEMGTTATVLGDWRTLPTSPHSSSQSVHITHFCWVGYKVPDVVSVK